jgi:hypothetical protein
VDDEEPGPQRPVVVKKVGLHRLRCIFQASRLRYMADLLDYFQTGLFSSFITSHMNLAHFRNMKSNCSPNNTPDSTSD